MSLKLYLTSAQLAEMSQDDPLRSLGGWKSSNALPNGLIHALFPLVSEKSRYEEVVEHRALILKNETGSEITNLTLTWTDPVDGVCQFEFAAVTTTDNGTKMEQISNSKATPYVGEFVDVSGSPATLVATLADQATIGLWIRRKVTKRSTLTSYDEVKAYCEAAGDSGQVEELSLQFDWS